MTRERPPWFYYRVRAEFPDKAISFNDERKIIHFPLARRFIQGEKQALEIGYDDMLMLLRFKDEIKLRFKEKNEEQF